MLFFTSFLLFYYIVFAFRDTNKMFWAEPVLVVWIIAFACEGLLPSKTKEGKEADTMSQATKWASSGTPD